MHMRGTARHLSLLLVWVILLPVLLPGCQPKPPAPTAAPAGPTSLPVVSSPTPAPTRTHAILPPTWTPNPAGQAIGTTTPPPTATATLNVPETIVAKATADRSTKCELSRNAWQVKITPSWKPGWCKVDSVMEPFYEYKLMIPSTWMIATFGEAYPNMAFITGQKGIELRLYQVYSYALHSYSGTLEDAPLKAAFCDENEHCTPVVSPLEKLGKKEIKNIGGKEVLVLDSQDGKYNIRRYFFFVWFKNYQPRANRLFFLKLYTPQPITGDAYKDTLQQLEDLLISIKPGVDI